MMKVVYISSDWKADAVQFDVAVASVRAAGYEVINTAPTKLNLDARIEGLELLEKADAVYFAPGWSRSIVGQFELSYCKYTGKPCAIKIEDLAEVLK